MAKHSRIVLVAAFVVVLGIPGGANRSAYEDYMKNAPQIPWKNIPKSALTYFFYNLRNVLLSLFGVVLAFLSAWGLGFSIGVVFWVISQNPLGIVAFSHGILELYSVFLGVVGGLLILAKIGEAIWDFFGKSPPHFVNWKEVAEEYSSIFLFSVTGLFVSAWMEAILSYAILYAKSLWALIAIVNTLISLLIVSYFSSSTIRALVTKKAELTVISTQPTVKGVLEAEKLPDGVWCLCPKCGAYISADIEYCPCGTKLPRRRLKG